jgi:hypothetical protein
MLKKPDAEKIALITKNFSALPLDAGDFYHPFSNAWFSPLAKITRC